jgi:hypothetical protein
MGRGTAGFSTAHALPFGRACFGRNDKDKESWLRVGGEALRNTNVSSASRGREFPLLAQKAREKWGTQMTFDRCS